MEKGQASAHPTNGVAEDEGKSGGLWPAVEALLLAASLFHCDDKSCDFVKHQYSWK